MSTTEFARTLAAAQSGDERAFAAIWRAHHPGLLRYLRVMSGGVAEDLASDTWLQVARTLPRFSGDEPAFRGWLFTIGRNRYIDWYRQLARRGQHAPDPDALELLPAGEDPAAVVEQEMSTKRAIALIERLPKDQAEAVMLRVIAELDVPTVAEIMGRPPGTVRVLAHRGLRRLAAELAAAADRPEDPGPSKPEPEGLAV